MSLYPYPCRLVALFSSDDEDGMVEVVEGLTRELELGGAGVVDVDRGVLDVETLFFFPFFTTSVKFAARSGYSSWYYAILISSSRAVYLFRSASPGGVGTIENSRFPHP